jgi:hypothetical protein
MCEQKLQNVTETAEQCLYIMECAITCHNVFNPIMIKHHQFNHRYFI